MAKTNKSGVLFALHDIEEFLRGNKAPLRQITLDYSPDLNRREKEILELCKKKSVKLRQLSQDGFSAAISGMFGQSRPKGLRHIVLHVPESMLTPMQHAGELEDLIHNSESPNSLILVLDGITDPHNLGAILRSADMFSVHAVVLPKKRSVHVNDTVRRISAGASHHMPVFYVSNLSRTLDMLKEEGYWIYAADLDGKSPSRLRLSGKTVLVMGSEGKGLGNEVKKHADDVVTIPTSGNVDSLNVSVAAGILMYAVREQMPVED
ncbi:23S rRNA (guanosine(2251)-2'-O)-methyltransferase RlmB [Salinispira pacifica]|uniref:23S rRNA (Guanosine-2'-O-)-methyltransferase rlmB n=1 Tax=Salinispira pacifica TaxID=1307761 RepID=V5WG33_9SPIO|nr:23S rRNA (guanosine(2251)-2'-O)-methyltransferase RlmB [Salinispira pacifica]AHC14758.1 23S rRNA (guanosine-2'-O-) -methyltransferase rlmB [Salinispira pacifica]